MTPKKDTWTIVIAGFWNRLIFSPTWVGKEIFDTKSVQCLVPLMPAAPLIFQHDDIALAVTESRLTITLKELSKQCLDKAEKTALKILSMLPHTPVSAVGINFGFIEKEPAAEILDIFRCRDNGLIAALGYTISETSIKRQLLFKGTLLNLTLSYDRTCFQLDANFHHDIQNTEQAREAIMGKVEFLCQSVTTIMKDVYELQNEEKEDDR